MLDEGAAEIESAGFTVDYLEARHAGTLAKVETLDDGPLRLLVAARLGAHAPDRQRRGVNAAPPLSQMPL